MSCSWRILVVTLWLVAGRSAAAQSFLQLYGQPYFDGSMAFSVTDSSATGSAVWIAFGLDPLPRNAPAPTQYGDLYIGDLKNLAFVGVIPPTGRLDVAFQMPSLIPSAVGVSYAVQAFVADTLSNPATLPFELPHLDPTAVVSIEHPVPTPGATFGDQVASGDLNDDGFLDIAVGAWFEDTGGVDKAGAVYVLWGPDYVSFAQMLPTTPLDHGEFGACVLVTDLTGDGVDDLLIAETSAYPAVPNGHGYLHLFVGGPSFRPIASLSLQSLEQGLISTVFGRNTIGGDFNNDSYLDLAVPMQKAKVGGSTDAGRVDVYWGPAFSSITQVLNPNPLASDFFGNVVACGDINGDGVDDLVQGSARIDVGGVKNVGRVHVYLGPALALSHSIDYPLPAVSQAGFGEDVQVADLDSDGLGDIICADDKDTAFIFWGGSPSNPTLIPKPPSQTVNPFGETLYALNVEAADVNGDGWGDVIIADPADGELPCPISSTGILYIALGPYYSTFHRMYDPGADCGDNLGFQIVVAEMDGDIFAELIVSELTADSGGVVNVGKIVLID